MNVGVLLVCSSSHLACFKYCYDDFFVTFSISTMFSALLSFTSTFVFVMAPGGILRADILDREDLLRRYGAGPGANQLTAQSPFSERYDSDRPFAPTGRFNGPPPDSNTDLP